LFYILFFISSLAFADYSLYVNKLGQFDLEADFEVTPSAEFASVSDLVEKGFHDEKTVLLLNKTSDFEIREQKFIPVGGVPQLFTKSCKQKFLWFCKELVFNCEVNKSGSSFKQVCRLDFEQKDAGSVFDKSMEVVNTLSCEAQAGKFFCKITGSGLPRATLLTDSKQLAIGGSTETFRGFFQMGEFFNRKNSVLPDPVAGSKEWQSHYELSMECSKKYQVFKILGGNTPLKRTCLEVQVK